MRLTRTSFVTLLTAGVITVQIFFVSVIIVRSQGTANAPVINQGQSNNSKRHELDTIREKGFSYLKASSWASGLSSFEVALAIAPNDAASLYGKSLALFNLNRPSDADLELDHAIDVLSKAGHNNRLLADSLVLSAVIAAVRNKQSLAIEKLERVIAFVPMHFDANLSLGRAYFGNGDISKSIKAFRQAVSIQPDHAKARFFLATALEREGNSAEALKEYRAILRRSSDNVEGNLGLGVLLLKVEGDRSAEGLIALQRAVTMDGNLYEGQIMLGKTLLRLNRASEAAEHLKKAADLAPNNPEPHFQLAIAYRKLGRKADADSETAIVKRIHEGRRGVAGKDLQ